MLLSRRRWLVAFCALALSWSALAAPPKPEPITVFAAASLKESLAEAAVAYEAQTGQPLRVSSERGGVRSE